MRILLALGLAAVASAQYPIPPRYDGYAKGDPSAPIFLEGFLDLMCPDSKASWPTVKKVISYYGPSKLRFDFHVFPLPCTWRPRGLDAATVFCSLTPAPDHWASYLANEGTHVLAATNASAVWPWIDAVFANQDSFGNDAIANNSFNKVRLPFARAKQHPPQLTPFRAASPGHRGLWRTGAVSTRDAPGPVRGRPQRP